MCDHIVAACHVSGGKDDEMTDCRAPRLLVRRRGMVAGWELPPCHQQSSSRRLETATASVVGVLAEDGRPHRIGCGVEHGARWPGRIRQGCSTRPCSTAMSSPEKVGLRQSTTSLRAIKAMDSDGKTLGQILAASQVRHAAADGEDRYATTFGILRRHMLV